MLVEPGPWRLRVDAALADAGNPIQAAGVTAVCIPPQVACEKTVSAMHHVLQRTIKCAKGTCHQARAREAAGTECGEGAGEMAPAPL